MKYFILLMFLSLSTSKIFAVDFPLISELGSSAKSIGMGNVEGFTDGPNTVFENPAALALTQDYSVSIFSSSAMNEAFYNSMALGAKTPLGKIGIGYMDLTVHNIPETYQTGSNATFDTRFHEKDFFDYKSSIFKISRAFTINENTWGGFSLNLYSKRFYTVNGRGYSFDFGTLHKVKNITLSAVAHNILPNGKMMYADGKNEDLPFQLVLGAQIPVEKYIRDNLNLIPQYKYTNKQHLLSMGLNYNPKMIPFVELLAGFKQHLSVTLDKKESLTLGIGLLMGNLRFYYAYEKSDYIEVDNKNHFSIQYSL